MSNPNYDPQKAHDYYEKHKHLKGRNRSQTENLTKNLGSTIVGRPRRPGEAMARTVSPKQAAQMRVVRLTEKIHKLNDALKQAQEALRNKRKEAKQNSDGKTTAKQRADAKKYRDTHKAQLATKQKKNSSSSGSSTSSSGPKSVSEMSESELTDRISKIRSAISNAKTQLQEANSLAHSLGDTNFIRHSGPTTVNTH